MNYPESLNNLINSLKKLPSIGEKSAERLAFAIMNFDEEEILLFSNSIKDVKSKIKKCSICGNITENEICDICLNEERDKTVICVVEDSKNIITLEKMGTYNVPRNVKGEGRILFIFSTKFRISTLLSSLKAVLKTATYSAINALEGTTITTSFLYFFSNSLNKNDFPALVGAEKE